MSTNTTETKIDAAPHSPAAGASVAKEAPTEQQPSQAGVPKRFLPGQTVCNEKNEKGKLCSGHLKQLHTGGEEAKKHLRGDDVLFKCQTCGALYMGPPLGHVRDPEKQSRFVEKDLMAILQAAGGTLPFFSKSKKIEPKAETTSATPATSLASAPGMAAPADETPEQKKARLIAEAKTRAAREGQATPSTKSVAKTATKSIASTSGTDSSPAADAHRPAAEAQAATGQASAAPMSPAAATASPAAGAETPADLAPDASTELTPGAPRNAAPQTITNSPARSTSEAPPTDEPTEQK